MTRASIAVTAVLLLAALASAVHADVVLYREIYPARPYGTTEDRFAVSIEEGWIGYRSSNMLLGPGVANANNILSIFDEGTTPSISKGAQVNSVPVGTLLPAEGHTDGYAFVSINVVGNCAHMTGEYNFAFADATTVQIDDRSSNAVARRVLFHIAGEDASLWWASEQTMVQPNPAAPVWTVLGVNVQTTTWRQCLLAAGDNGSTMFTGVTSPTLAGTVDQFGLWEDNPGPGNRRWDNYIINGIPEPTTLVLLGLGGLSMIRRRR